MARRDERDELLDRMMESAPSSKMPVSSGARSTIKSIFSQFKKIRQESSPKAFRWLQDALNDEADRLVPEIISLKDHVQLTMQLEDYLRGNVSDKGEIPTTKVLDGLCAMLNLDPKLAKKEADA